MRDRRTHPVIDERERRIGAEHAERQGEDAAPAQRRPRPPAGGGEGASSLMGLGRSWVVLTALMAPVILQMPVHEFVKLHRLSEQELRARFDLPASCDPMLTAAGPGRSEVMVMITCHGAPEGDAPREVRTAPR